MSRCKHCKEGSQVPACLKTLGDGNSAKNDKKTKTKKLAHFTEIFHYFSH